jgi:hypothetical protein
MLSFKQKRSRKAKLERKNKELEKMNSKNENGAIAHGAPPPDSSLIPPYEQGFQDFLTCIKRERKDMDLNKYFIKRYPSHCALMRILQISCIF